MDGFIRYKEHVNPLLAQLLSMTGMNPKFVKAFGSILQDDKGHEFLDFFSGSGTFNMGHNHTAVLKTIEQTLKEMPLQIYGVALSPYMGDLASKLVDMAQNDFEIAFFSNSGSEAVEGAIKIARACTQRTKLVYCQNAYHGTTMGSLSLMEQGPFKDPFEPLLQACVKIPFNDLAALEQVLQSKDCAAFILEPVQAEGGIHVPDPDYLKQAKTVCHNYGTLLVLDEIQTGLGRTGHMFAFQGHDMAPDIFTLAKALGGGIMPIGAYITTREIYEKAYGTYALCESHHTTFGGNTLACQAALCAVNWLDDENRLAHVRQAGQYLFTCLNQTISQSPLVKEIRGQGLLMGIEFAPIDHPQLQWESLDILDFSNKHMTAQLIMKHLYKQHILTQTCAHAWQVLKIEPPLIIEQHQLEQFIEALEASVRWLESIL